jgi:hypothetical protein
MKQDAYFLSTDNSLYAILNFSLVKGHVMNTLIALTCEEIEQKKTQIKYTKQRDKLMLLCSPLGMMLFLCLYFLATYSTLSETMGLVLFGLSLALIMIGYVGYIRRDYRTDYFLFDSLNPFNCQEMLELIETVSEGKNFQQQIMNQNRQFINYDFMLLKEWRDTEEQRHACKKLYQIN